jgi:hypothetical protein
MVHLSRERFNCLFAAGALGGGHVPPTGLLRAIELVDEGGLIVLTIHEKWLQPNDAEGFSSFLTNLTDAGQVTVTYKHPFVHRLTTGGEPITFHVIAAQRGKAAA